MRLASNGALLLCAAALTASVGCQYSSDRQHDALQTVTSIDGDTIVVRTVGASDSSAMLRLVPEVRIGMADGPDAYTFADIGMAIPAPGGGVYVWDRRLKALRQFDSAGVFVRQIGHVGGGPGEYQGVSGMASLPDGRLALWDWRSARINVYDSTGIFRESWRFPGQAVSTDGLHVDPTGNLALLTYLEDWNPEAPAARRQGVVRVSGVDGRIRDSLGAPVLPEPLVLRANFQSAQQTGSVWFPLPFAPRPQWAWSSRGYFASASGARYAVTLHRLEEPPLRIEREVAAVRVEPDERENHTEVLTAGLRAMDPSWRWQGPPVPETKAFFTALRVDADGRLWLRRSRPGVRTAPAERAVDDRAPDGNGPARPRLSWHEPEAYDVFDPEGLYLGFLPLADSVSILNMKGDVVWGVVRDSLDVPYVTRFRLEPRPSERRKR